MTEQQKLHAAKVLLGTKALTGGDEPKFLPKIYVVNGECCLFLNAARRVAYGTKYPIEVMTIEEAWEIHTGKNRETLNEAEVEKNFDQTGGTYMGMLFCDNMHVYSGMIQNPIICKSDNKIAKEEVLDQPISRLSLSVRAQNVLTLQGLNTYRELLEFGRDKMLKLRNMGVTTVAIFDAEMNRVGLYDYWKENKPVK